MSQNFNFIKNIDIIDDNKSNEINPFKGLPMYFIRKGKKQIIQKYFTLFFFRILQNSKIDHNNKNKNDKPVNNLSDLFFKTYWNTLPFFELKLLPKYRNNLHYEFFRIFKSRWFKRKKQKFIRKNLIGFSTIPRNKQKDTPVVSITVGRKSNLIIPLKIEVQEKLRKRWTFQYIKSVKKNNRLLSVLFTVFENDLIKSKNKIANERNVGTRYFIKEFYWTLNNFSFFQDRNIKSHLLFHIIPREYKLTRRDLKLFRKNNKKFIEFHLKDFFFNRLLNKYLNISANNYFLKPGILSYYLNTNLFEREVHKLNIERNKNLFIISKLIKKNNLQKRFFNNNVNDVITNDVLNSNNKNNNNNFFLKEGKDLKGSDANKNISIRLIFKSFDKKNIEYSKIMVLKLFSKKRNIKTSIIDLPIRKTKYTVLKSPHIDKKSRDQYEKIIHKSFINFTLPQKLLTKNFINYFLYLIKKISPTIYIQYSITKQ